ncbi:MAG: DUF6583 family protein [Clostridia bacterium]
MMPRKKRRFLLFLIIFIILVIMASAFAFLYVKTDMFKSNEMLFNKYSQQLIDNTKEMIKQENMEELNQTLKNNKLNKTTKMSVQYSENGDKSSEINNINLNIDGQKDQNENYDYKNIKLANGEEKLMEAEYLQEKNNYAIKLDGIKQYIVSSSEEDNLIKIIGEIADLDIKSLANISEDEFNQLKEKYINIINSNIKNQSYSKKKGVSLKINDKTYDTNAYILTISKEKFNDIYVKVLEELKKEDIILNKISDIDNQINDCYKAIDSTAQSNLKQEYIDKIEEKIKNIQNSNIGTENRVITVYENRKTAISLSIESEDKTAGLDVINSGTTNFINILQKENTKDNEKENSIDLKIQRVAVPNDNEYKLVNEVVKDGIKTTDSITTNTKMENTQVTDNIKWKRTTDNNELDVTSDTTMKIINNFDNQKKLSDLDSVTTDKMDDEKKERIKKIIANNINEQVKKIDEKYSINKIEEMLVNMNLMKKKAENVSSQGNVTEAEKTRFNSNFELYAGKEISQERILELVNVAKKHLKAVKITKYNEEDSSSDTKEPLEYKLVLEKDKENDQLGDKLIKKLEEQENNNFDVTMEYDDNTGLISNIYISLKK